VLPSRSIGQELRTQKEQYARTLSIQDAPILLPTIKRQHNKEPRFNTKFFFSIDLRSHGLTVPRSGKIVCEEMVALRTTYHDGKHNLQMKVP